MKIALNLQSLKDVLKKIRERSEFRKQAARHGRELKLVQDNLGKINKGEILLFATLRNEACRIPYFLKYYRALDVRHFVFVDNGSSDGFSETIKNEEDVSCFYTESSYKASNFGMHWLNHLMNRYGNKHWCLVCDPDEFFVYPRMDVFPLRNLTQYLDKCHRRSFFTVLLDMYGKEKLDSVTYNKGDDPLVHTPYFDKIGYFSEENSYMYSLWIQGGIRQRMHFNQDPESAPALNKIPLIKWRKGYYYISSMHMAIPRRLNRSYETGLTGALLHFKYFSSFTEKVEEELARKEHYRNSREYILYNKNINASFYHPEVSIRYEGWKQLEEMGLIIGDEWR